MVNASSTHTLSPVGKVSYSFLAEYLKPGDRRHKYYILFCQKIPVRYLLLHLNYRNGVAA
ncbi:MAG TPA: hypothetical protein VE956_19060 [Nodularia sp. (in: cyanobacteria)]|nr:hypothetical protein [Nodularia sp. (in: cyanobacteria)]